jgi:hypothetical protein
MGDFVFSEFESLYLGDARLDARFCLLMQRMMQAPSASVLAACSGWAETKGAYRLFNHPKVTMEAVLAPHRESLLVRAEQHECIALIQDTTELDYSTHTAMQGRGFLNSEQRRGFFLHSQYAVSSTRIPLGIWHTQLVTREQIKGKYKASLPIEQKESFRWVEGMRHAHALARKLPHKEVFSVADREGDIYEVLHECMSVRQEEGGGAHVLVRAGRDRVVESLVPCGESEPDMEAKGTLFELTQKARALGCVEFKIPSRRGVRTKNGRTAPFHRKSRSVRLEVKACEVTLPAPWRHRKGVKFKPCRMWMVIAQEIDAPEDPEEPPMRWVLLTSYAVESFEDARKILNLYMARWDIEVFHRVLKTGCKIEHLRFKDRAAFEPALACNMIVAWRLQYLVHLGRECPELPCSCFFGEDEWRAAVAVHRKVANPMTLAEPSLGEMVRIVARFGGHLGRKHDAPPGAQCMWTGLARVRDFAIAIEVCRQDA